MPDIIAQTERLTIAPFTNADSDFIIELVNSPGWLEFIGDRNIRDSGAARHYIENSLQASYRQNGYGLYRLDLRENDTPVGMCGLVNRHDLPAPDLGFAMLPASAGQGLAFEASKAILAYAKTELALDILYAITNAANDRSIRLLNHLGFVDSAVTYEDVSGNSLNVYERPLTLPLQ